VQKDEAGKQRQERQEEARLQQMKAKQAYEQRVEQARRDAEQQAAKRRQVADDAADRKRRERDDDERRRAKVAQEKRAKEEMAKQKEKEEIERAKEEKKMKRDHGREAMMQDIARRRKEKIVVSNKRPETENNQANSGIRNSSYCSNKSESEARRPSSRGLGSRNNSVENIKQIRSSQERPSSKHSYGKKPDIPKFSSEKKLKPEISKVEMKQSDPQLRNLSKVEKPPQPIPTSSKISPEAQKPMLKRLDSNGSRRSKDSSRHEHGSVISGLTNDRTQDRHLFEYTDASNNVVDYPEYTGFQNPNFGKTAYFIAENGTGGFNDFKDDIFDINKASNEINNRLFSDDPPGFESPTKTPKIAATNLDFITIKKQGEALKVEEDDPTYYLSGYGQLETLRNQIEKKVGDRFLELYIRIKELLEKKQDDSDLDLLYEDPKLVIKELKEDANSLQIVKSITMITKLILKEQTLEESEKHNIYSQMM
jgi:hypothetical protein